MRIEMRVLVWIRRGLSVNRALALRLVTVSELRALCLKVWFVECKYAGDCRSQREVAGRYQQDKFTFEAGLREA
jgi:hypothetical protein